MEKTVDHIVRVSFYKINVADYAVNCEDSGYFVTKSNIKYEGE